MIAKEIKDNCRGIKLFVVCIEINKTPILFESLGVGNVTKKLSLNKLYKLRFLKLITDIEVSSSNRLWRLLLLTPLHQNNSILGQH